MPRRNRHSTRGRLIPRIKEPINIYISSHTDEFAEFRRTIKARIRSVRIKQFKRRLFLAEIVEDYPSTNWRAAMDKLLSQCSILVLVIGRKRSKRWVEYEIKFAKKNDIPILAYEYYRRMAHPPPTETTALVNKLKPQITLHGRGNKRFEDEDQLRIAILKDLVEQIGIMIHDYTNVKREIIASYAKQKQSISSG